jgi:beta-1,4-mannosyl-glycoprotein beta-1,4-N-acetylglucosaminyltransferase
MIIDAFLYNGEAECLEIRLHELGGVVDKFIAMEAKQTFTGNPKEPMGDREGDRIRQWGGRYIYMVDRIYKTVDDPDPWQRETFRRNNLLFGLAIEQPAADDIILIGDVDEIPSAAAVLAAAEQARTGVQVAFDQTLCTYYVNNQCVNMRWRGTQAVRYDYLKSVTPQGVRDYRNMTPYFVENGGWHFSSLVLDDPVGRMTAKIQAFSHQEVNRPEVLDPENIRRRVALGQDIQGRTDVRFKVERDAVLPQYVVENKERLASLYYPGSV